MDRSFYYRCGRERERVFFVVARMREGERGWRVRIGCWVVFLHCYLSYSPLFMIA